MHILKKIALVAWLVILGNTCFSQSTPQLVQQVKFETGLDEVLSSPHQNTFLVISGDKYTLIDQTSKIQLGTLVFDAGSWSAQGVGKTAIWGDSSILISTAFELMIADPISGSIDTFFNANKYPEIIEDFIPLSDSKILIHTKTYPLNKDSSVSAINIKNERTEYLGAKDCKLYLYNGITRKIEKVVATPYLFTIFTAKLFKGNLLAGTLEGDVVEIDTLLNQKKLFHAFDTTIHSVLACGDYIAVVPASSDKYVVNKPHYGAESIYFFKNNKREKVITFRAQEPKAGEFSLLSPSATIFRAFYQPKSNNVLVNYGFSRLVNISLTNFDTSHYPINYNMAKFYSFDKEKTRLLTAVDTKQTVFAAARNQSLYDLGKRRFLPAFKPIENQQRLQQFYKTYDAQGNYHIIAYKQDYSSDTIVIYSSNKTQPTTIACKWCKFTVDAKNKFITLKKYRHAKVLKLPFSKMSKSLYTIDFKSPPKIFEQVFTTENISKEKQFSSINNIQQLNPNNYLVIGAYYKNDVSKHRVSVVNNNKEFAFDKTNIEKVATTNLATISPSKKYIALTYKKGKKQILEVWDWEANKKVFSKKVGKKNSIDHFVFDKTKDVLWYAFEFIDRQKNISKKIYSVTLNTAKPKENLEFIDNRYFSFVVDKQNDRVAFEAYNELFVAQLSTQKILWQKTPQSNNFEVTHLTSGFSFSNKTELHTFQNDSNYLFFTSFDNNKAVEVANNYLYKGNKSAINNLAFVYQRKGYLPADYDLYFNRPDKVIQLSGSENEEYNSLINEAQAKRSRKAATVSLNALLTQSPKLEVSNKEQLPFSVNQNHITLNIKAKSERFINHLHITANGAPIYGENGLSLEKQNTQTLSQKVELQKGNNTLQVYVEDENGIISPTETVNIVANYSYTPKTYFIGIGIDKFLDSNQNLSYSVKDIYDLKNALKAKLDTQLVSYMFANEDVKVANITHLNSVLEQTNVNDKVIISYSGHGLLNKKFDYYLSTTNIDFRRPEKNGLPYKVLEKLLDSIPARQKLLFIDACHSGEVDKEAINNMKVILGDTTKNLKQGSKSGIELLVDESTVGLKNSFELMQELFVDVGRGTGTNIISAAAGTQVAYEQGGLKNGVFTYCILQMLKEQPNCTVQQLKEFVSAEVERLTDGLQKPTSRNEVVGFNWQVW